jgi:hypothetical protein
MLTKYNEFILESLINESVLVYSDRFKRLIDEIDSPVSQAISDLESKDFNITNNYIDLQDKEHISFILDRRAKQIEENSHKFVTYRGGSGFLKHVDSNELIFKELQYEPVGDITYHPPNGERGEVLNKATSIKTGKVYLRVNFPGGISVINQNNVEYDNVRKLAFSKNRQPIRIGRGIRAILNSAKLKFSDSEIEQFVNKFKSEWDKLNDIFRSFEIVEGYDIKEWYYSGKYREPNSGQLGNSCMRYDYCQGFFEIYTENPDKCKLLILKDEEDEEKIKGRAIIWYLDEPNIIFMDRIYTNFDSDIELFRQYAISKDWNYKKYNSSSSDTTVINKSGEKRYEQFIVNLKSENDLNYGAYPYMDTLKYFHYLTGKLTTDHTGSGKTNGYVRTLEDTEGSYSERNCDTCEGTGRVNCYDCDGSGEENCPDCWISAKRRSTGEQICSTCDGDGNVECSTCDGKGENSEGEDCQDCHGGRMDCDDCGASGHVDCDNCGGNAEVSCSSCYGDGVVDCTDCS